MSVESKNKGDNRSTFRLSTKLVLKMDKTVRVYCNMALLISLIYIIIIRIQKMRKRRETSWTTSGGAEVAGPTWHGRAESLWILVFRHKTHKKDPFVV